MIAFSSDVLGEDLRDRLDRSCREARRLLGQSSSDGDPGAPGQLPGLIANLTEITERRAGGERAAIGTAHEAALGRLRDRFEARFEALARAHAAVARLRGVDLTVGDAGSRPRCALRCLDARARDPQPRQRRPDGG